MRNHASFNTLHFLDKCIFMQTSLSIIRHILVLTEPNGSFGRLFQWKDQDQPTRFSFTVLSLYLEVCYKVQHSKVDSAPEESSCSQPLTLL